MREKGTLVCWATIRRHLPTALGWPDDPGGPKGAVCMACGRCTRVFPLCWGFYRCRACWFAKVKATPLLCQSNFHSICIEGWILFWQIRPSLFYCAEFLFFLTTRPGSAILKRPYLFKVRYSDEIRSCAMGIREPCQVGNKAALNGTSHVPRGSRVELYRP